MIDLASLASALGAELRGDGSIVIRGVRHDSRAIEPGDLFVAIAGQTARGSEFAGAAVARGAVAIASEQWIEGVAVPQLRVPDARIALARAAHAAYGDPTAQLRVIGVTGTNGKTTTTWLIDEALTALGKRPALLGTVETRGPGVREASAFTTPEADAIARFARSMVDGGATELVMEISSHALALHRADAMRIDVAAFTNLTQDHLDFHGTMEAYFEAKARLFTELAPRRSVIRIDDPRGLELAARVADPITVSRGAASATVRATDVAIDRDGVRARVTTPWGEGVLESALIGAHNLDNLLVAAACVIATGVAPQAACEALRHAKGAPGRLERVADPRDVAVLVDYAHSPDALSNVLDALRPLTPGRLVCVFGCGGDRDRGKRPKMGEAAASRADISVVTSDNPRTEDPRAIVDMIVPGVTGTGSSELDASALSTATRGHLVEVDRRAAITLALAAARPGDTVLIAGKGHEDYQIVGTTKHPFDDRLVARDAIEAALGAARGEA